MTLWTARVATGNLANYPYDPATCYERALANVTAIKRTGADLISLQECWHWHTQAGIMQALPSPFVRHSEGPAQSVVIAWDSQKWLLLHRDALLLHGPVMGGKVCDARWMPYVVLQAVGTERKVIFAGVHPTPTATRRGPIYAAAAALARRRAYRTFAAWAKVQPYPIIASGDWNDETPGRKIGRLLGHPVADVGRPTGDRIDRHVLIDGRRARLTHGTWRLVKLPSTDHPGAVVADVTAVSKP